AYNLQYNNNMLLYLIIIAIADAAILFLNLHFNWLGVSDKQIIIMSLLQPVLLIAEDGLAATILRWIIPVRFFTYKTKISHVSKTECKIYEGLLIKHWKDHIIELGMFTNFSKKSVENPEDRAYIERFIMECNSGAWGHILGIIFGYAAILFFPRLYWQTIFIPAACVNAVLSFLPFMILRYNLPRLHRLRNLLEKKEIRNAAKNK
ncbi:MAG: hypothetical protein K6C98_01810, partial [Treponema sp.]|nr:hypothetical protein [Treponema sp.]